MRCICCNSPFTPTLIRHKQGKVTFETMCTFCKADSQINNYTPDWEHSAISELPIVLYE